MSSESDNNLQLLLTDCGIDGGREAVLTYLTRFGSSTAGAIARYTKLKRPTVYSILQQLVIEGYVTKKRTNKVFRFTPLPHKSLLKLIDERARDRFNTVGRSLAGLEKLLAQLPEEGQSKVGEFEIETIESASGLYEQMYESLLAGDFCSFFNPQITVTPKARPYLLEFFKSTAKTKPTIREIAVRGPVTDWYKSQVRNPKHLVREIGSEFLLPTDTILVDNSVLLLDYLPHQETAVRIRHKRFYTTMSTIFEVMWRMAK